VLGWQGRTIAEGSRSSIVILRITQRAYPTSIGIITQALPSVYYSTFLPLSLYPLSDVRKRPCKSSNSDRSLEVRSSKPPQQNLTFAQTHQAPRQPHQHPSRTSRRLQQHTRPALGLPELPCTAAVTQFTHFSDTTRPHTAAVLFCASSTSSISQPVRTDPVPLLKMDDRFSPRSAHSDDALAQTLHDPMFEPQPSFNFADSHNEEPRPLQPSMGSPNAPNQNQQTFFNPVNGTR
jgi:hypothetical protein